MAIPTAAQIDESVRHGISYALSKGLTQAHCTEVDWVAFDSLRRLRSRGALGLRFYVYHPLADWQKTVTLMRHEGRGDEWLRWGGSKVVFDGSLGSRTALFYKPYLDDPCTRGIVVTDPKDLRDWMGAAEQHDDVTIVVMKV